MPIFCAGVPEIAVLISRTNGTSAAADINTGACLAASPLNVGTKLLSASDFTLSRRVPRSMPTTKGRLIAPTSRWICRDNQRELALGLAEKSFNATQFLQYAHRNAQRHRGLNVGYSRLYRHSSAGLVRLSQDDVPIGTSGPGLRRSSHLVTQSLGGRTANTPIRPHLGSTGPLTVGETLLLCSDGLTDMVGEDDVASAIDPAKDIEESAANLLDLALSNGGRDNIAIVVVRIMDTKGSGRQEPPARPEG
jgi:hypothetical protein